MRAQTDQGARHGQEQGQPVPLRSGRPERAALGQAHGPGWRGAEASRACLLRLPEQLRAAQRGSWVGAHRPVGWWPRRVAAHGGDCHGCASSRPPDRRTASAEEPSCPAQGKGGKNRRRGKNDSEAKRELTFKEDGQGATAPPRAAHNNVCTAAAPAAPGSASAVRASRLALRRVRTSDADAGKWEAGGLLL